MRHLFKVYAVRKFSYFHLWYLNSYAQISAGNSQCGSLILVNDIFISPLIYLGQCHKSDKSCTGKKIVLQTYFLFIKLSVYELKLCC